MSRNWTSVRAFSVEIPFHEVDTNAIELSLQEATKIGDSLMHLCSQKYLRDEIFNSLFMKKASGGILTADENQYLMQAMANYRELICEKFSIVLSYVGNWYELSVEQRNKVYRLAEKYPSVEVRSSNMPGEQRRAFRLNIGQKITLNQADEIVNRYV